METKSELEGAGGGIKPKVEPGEEQEHSPTLQPPAFDDDWEVTPLTGDNPFFTTIISKTHVQRFLLVRTDARWTERRHSDIAFLY